MIYYIRSPLISQQPEPVGSTQSVYTINTIVPSNQDQINGALVITSLHEASHIVFQLGGEQLHL